MNRNTLLFRATLAAALLCLALFPPHALASNCAGTSTGLVPVTDLGPGFYQGMQGGLYPGGSNLRPASHEAAGTAIANAIAPAGHAGCARSIEWPRRVRVHRYEQLHAGVQRVRAQVRRRSGAQDRTCARSTAPLGGQTAQILAQPTSAYWDTVFTRLRGHGSSPRQVQIVWLKDANSNPTGGFAVTRDTLTAQFFRIVQIIKQKLPNAKLCYFTSRIYAGYASSTLNPEPYAYENAFSVKQVIERQLSGDPALNFDSAHGRRRGAVVIVGTVPLGRRAHATLGRPDLGVQRAESRRRHAPIRHRSRQGRRQPARVRATRRHHRAVVHDPRNVERGRHARSAHPARGVAESQPRQRRVRDPRRAGDSLAARGRGRARSRRARRHRHEYRRQRGLLVGRARCCRPTAPGGFYWARLSSGNTRVTRGFVRLR